MDKPISNRSRHHAFFSTFFYRILMSSLGILLLLSTGAWGFLDSDLDLKIRFERIHGLQAGDRVFFQENTVGKVETVRYLKEGLYMAEVSIESNFSNAATEHSEFYIVQDPENRGRQAVEVFQKKPGGALLGDGAIVEGASGRSLLLERLAMDIERGLESLKKEFDHLQGDIEKIPESDEYRTLKQQLAELADRLKKAGRETRQKVQEDLLPLLARELEKLKQQLERMSREKPEKPEKTVLSF